jgi:hypothetical protein
LRQIILSRIAQPEKRRFGNYVAARSAADRIVGRIEVNDLVGVRGVWEGCDELRVVHGVVVDPGKRDERQKEREPKGSSEWAFHHSAEI